MITIDSKFKKDVQMIQEFNRARDQMVDYYIQKIGERAGLKTDEDYDTLWDHVMNQTEWTVEYKDTSKPSKRKKK
jgi:RNAse (barnase) inhibitor barstar